MIDKHSLAIISLAGSASDVLGALYLAYDLLGGEHGPLRTLTRAVTYGLLFGTGFGLALGPVFGVASGATHAITLALEFSRAARAEPEQSIWQDILMSGIRAAGFAVGAAFLFGAVFGISFGLFSLGGQVVAYRRGMRPTVDYAPATRPRITRRQLLGAVNRTLGYTFAGYVSAMIAHQRTEALGLGIETGLVIGAVTAVSIACTPFIEWIAEHLPARRMGVAGVVLILIGFSLQSVQYWLALFDVTIR